MIAFGHPKAHENDVDRAVKVGLEIAREVETLSSLIRQRFDFEIQVRVGIHRGVVYLDLEQDDVYGLAANVTSRVSGLAPPGSVVVSASVEPLIRDQYELSARPAQPVKGIEEPVDYFVVHGESSAHGPTLLGALVGREPEVEYLTKSWSQAVTGELVPSGVSLQGDAGIGKSRLTRTAVDLANRSQAVILKLVGSPFHTDVGLWPVRRLLEWRCGITRSSGPAERLQLLSAELGGRSLDRDAMIPLLAPVLGIGPEAGYDAVHVNGRKLYEQIAVAVHEYLLACVGDAAALVVAEDMHWFDEDTVEVVTSLLGENLGRLMIVMTGREQSMLPSGAGVKAFQLRPLTDDQADELIVSLYPDINAADRTVVRHRSDGVPLFIEEIVAKVEAQATRAVETLRVPDTLYEALFARLRSSRGARLAVEAAATIGSYVDRSLLLAVVDMKPPAFDDVVKELQVGRVLEPAGEHGWRFRHELLREVAAELPPPSVRRRLHGRIADAIAATAPDGNPDWPAVAGHYEQAERYVEAAVAYQQASTDARRRGSVNEARAHLTSAISQIERAAPGSERDRIETALRLRRGFLIYAAEGVSSPNAAAEFERCLEITGTDRSDDLLSTLSAMYAYFAIRADLDRVHQLLETVRQAIEGDHEWFRPFNHAGFGMLAWYRGDFEEAQDKLETAAAARNDEHARALAPMWFMPNEPTASIYTHLAHARVMRGDLAGAEAELARTAHLCARADFPQGAFSLAYARQLDFLMRVEAGQLDQATAVAADLARLGEHHGFDSWAFAGAVQGTTAAALATLGDKVPDPVALQSHIAALEMFVDTWRALGVNALITFYDAIVARLLIAAGERLAARDRIETALALAQETEMRFHNAELLRIRAQTHSDNDSRAADLARSIALARQQGAIIYELRSAADDFELRGEQAREVFTQAINQFPADSTWPPLAQARMLIG
jgi:hypothetical protein